MDLFLIPCCFSVLQVLYILLFYRMERKHLNKLEGKTTHLSSFAYYYLLLVAGFNTVFPILLLVVTSFFVDISPETPILRDSLLYIFSLLPLMVWNYLFTKGYIGFYINNDQLYMIKYNFWLRLVDFKTIPMNSITKCKVIHLDISSNGGILEFSIGDEKLYFSQENSPVGRLEKVFNNRNIPFETEKLKYSEYKQLGKKVQTRIK